MPPFSLSLSLSPSPFLSLSVSLSLFFRTLYFSSFQNPGHILGVKQIIGIDSRADSRIDPRIDRPVGYHPRPISPNGSTQTPVLLSSGLLYGINGNSINQNQNQNQNSAVNASVGSRSNFSAIGSNVTVCNALGSQGGSMNERDEMIDGLGRAIRGSSRLSSFSSTSASSSGTAAPVAVTSSSSSYDITAYNELRAQALRIRSGGGTQGSVQGQGQGQGQVQNGNINVGSNGNSPVINNNGLGGSGGNINSNNVPQSIALKNTGPLMNVRTGPPVPQTAQSQLQQLHTQLQQSQSQPQSQSHYLTRDHNPQGLTQVRSLHTPYLQGTSPQHYILQPPSQSLSQSQSQSQALSQSPTTTQNQFLSSQNQNQNQNQGGSGLGLSQQQQQLQQQQQQHQQRQQIRSQNRAFAPLGFDDAGRPRNSSILPPGQSQQIFQSQQQLQEQESSRLHHLSQHSQAQYFSNNDYITENDEIIDNSLELSIKAKPFIPQYTSTNMNSTILQSQSHNSSSHMGGSLLHQHLSQGHSFMSNLNSNSSSGNIGNNSGLLTINSNMNNSGISGLGSPSRTTGSSNQSNGLIDPWGSIGLMRPHVPVGDESQNNAVQKRGLVFDKHGSNGLTGVSTMSGNSVSNGSNGMGNINNNNGFNMSLLTSFGGISSPLGTSPGNSSGSHLQHSSQYAHSPPYSILNGIPSDRSTLRDRNTNHSSYSSSPRASGNRGMNSAGDQYGLSNLTNSVDQQDAYSDVPSLLSGLMSNKGSLGGALGSGRESFGSDRFSHSLDSDDSGGVFGIRDSDPYRDQGINHLNGLGSLGGLSRPRPVSEDQFGMALPLPLSSGSVGTLGSNRAFNPNIHNSTQDNSS